MTSAMRIPMFVIGKVIVIEFVLVGESTSRASNASVMITVCLPVVFYTAGIIDSAHGWFVSC